MFCTVFCTVIEDPAPVNTIFGGPPFCEVVDEVEPKPVAKVVSPVAAITATGTGKNNGGGTTSEEWSFSASVETIAFD